MSVRRVMGTETEFGISVPGPARGQPDADLDPGRERVRARRSRSRATARWDFDEEHPLRDARGFDLTREVADSSQLTDEDTRPGQRDPHQRRPAVRRPRPPGVLQRPRCTNPRDAVLWDKAGERVMGEAPGRRRQHPRRPADPAVQEQHRQQGRVLRHARELPDAPDDAVRDIVRHLTPFFVSRQVVTGAGRVGIGQDGREHGFQISQRADYFEVEVGLETTLKRPIINTRDEPHADAEKYRRLHVIIGDANLSEISTYLKVGTTSLVLSMIEDRFLTDDLARGPARSRALHEVSHDPTLHAPGHAHGRPHADRGPAADGVPRAGPQVRRGPYGADADRQTKDVLAPLGAGARTGSSTDPMSCPTSWTGSPSCELLEGYRDRDGLDWDDARLHLVDLQYADVRPDKGLYNRLVPRGRMQRLVTDEEVADGDAPAAGGHPGVLPRPLPGAVRRRGRGRLLGLGDLRSAGPDSLQRVPTLEPLRGTKAHVGALLDRCDTARTWFARSLGVPPGRVADSNGRSVGRLFHSGLGGECHGDRTAVSSTSSRSVRRPRKRSRQVEAPEDVQERQEKLDDDVDSILDEIDEVLEENAEEFVRRIRAKGWGVRPLDDSRCLRPAAGRLPDAQARSSFMDFLAAHAPDLLPGTALPAGRRRPRRPHGTTIVAATFPGGVVMAGDRRATMGNMIAQRDIEKVFPADEYSCVGIAGTAGLAVEMVRLFQVELEHYEKLEGATLSLDGKANRLAAMIRGNLGDGDAGPGRGAAVRGLRPGPRQGPDLLLRRRPAAATRRPRFHTVGSGSLFARAR